MWVVGWDGGDGLEMLKPRFGASWAMDGQWGEHPSHPCVPVTGERAHLARKKGDPDELGGPRWEVMPWMGGNRSVLQDGSELHGDRGGTLAPCS